MVKAVFAMRGRARAIVIADRVVVPVCGQNTNRMRGDVRVEVTELPLQFDATSTRMAMGSRAETYRPADAWEILGPVPAALVRRVLAELRRMQDERMVAAKWAAAK